MMVRNGGGVGARAHRKLTAVAMTVAALGGLLVSVSAVAQPAPRERAQAPIDRPACESLTSWQCIGKCDGAVFALQGPAEPPNARACDELGRMYRDGTTGGAGRDGGPAGPDVASAKQRFFQSCSLSYWGGCNDLADVYLKSGDATQLPQVRSLYDKACKLATPRLTHEACFALGGMSEAGRGGPRDLAAAALAYQLACDGGDTRGCDGAKRLGLATRKSASPPPAGNTTRAPVR